MRTYINTIVCFDQMRKQPGALSTNSFKSLEISKILSVPGSDLPHLLED